MAHPEFELRRQRRAACEREGARAVQHRTHPARLAPRAHQVAELGRRHPVGLPCAPRTRRPSAPARTRRARRASPDRPAPPSPRASSRGPCGSSAARRRPGRASSVPSPWPAGRWPLAAGRWPLAAGRWPLAAGRWPLASLYTGEDGAGVKRMFMSRDRTPAAGSEDASTVIAESPPATADDRLFDTSSMTFSPQLSGRARHHRRAGPDPLR